MAWKEGVHCPNKENCRNTLEKLSKIEGDINTREAQVAFAEYCSANPKFSAQLLMGFDLWPFQDVMIRAMMQKDYFLGICGRGLGKTTMASIFVPLYAIFNPGVTIGITSASFRQARQIFEKIEAMSNKPEGRFLKQCMKGEPKHKGDAWEMTLGSSKIVALPLGCVSSDTLIQTNYGWQRAENLCPETEEEWRVEKFNVNSTDGETRCSHSFRSKNKKLNKITTSMGYEIMVSDDHRLMTPSGWVKSSDLKKSDKIRIFYKDFKPSQAEYSSSFSAGRQYGASQTFRDSIDEKFLKAGFEFGVGFIFSMLQSGLEIDDENKKYSISFSKVQVAKDIQCVLTGYGILCQRKENKLFFKKIFLKRLDILFKRNHAPQLFKKILFVNVNDIDDDYVDLQIKKIERGAVEEKCYDFRVPAYTSYCSGGFMSHNSGDKIRGYRFNLLVIDELLILSEKIINEVLLPFMAVQINPRERQKIRDAEEALIECGKLNPEDRTVYSNNKLIGLTSASYQFEYLYTMFKSYQNLIFDKQAKNVSHGIMQLSCEIAPPGLYDVSNVENAKKTFSKAQFDREYMASFTGDSSGFYSAKKLFEATVPIGGSPCVRIKGDSSKSYILSIDPNYDSSEGSDHFAMCLLEIEEEEKMCYNVHNYAVASCSLSERMEYIKYLFDNFNIKYMIVDRAGGEKFVKDINDLNILDFRLDFFENDINSFTEEEISLARESYDPNGQKVKKIVHSQYFHHAWIRVANEALAGAIENKKIMFAAPASAEAMNKDGISINSIIFTEEEKYGNSKEELELKMNDFIEHQSTLIKLTKNQCSLIEVSTSTTGVQRFDLPSSIKNQTGPQKARKDSYSALLLANWAKDCYFAITSATKKKVNRVMPQFIG